MKTQKRIITCHFCHILVSITKCCQQSTWQWWWWWWCCQWPWQGQDADEVDRQQCTSPRSPPASGQGRLSMTPRILKHGNIQKRDYHIDWSTEGYRRHWVENVDIHLRGKFYRIHRLQESQIVGEIHWHMNVHLYIHLIASKYIKHRKIHKDRIRRKDKIFWQRISENQFRQHCRPLFGMLIWWGEKYDWSPTRGTSEVKIQITVHMAFVEIRFV